MKKLLIIGTVMLMQAGFLLGWYVAQGTEKATAAEGVGIQDPYTYRYNGEMLTPQVVFLYYRYAVSSMLDVAIHTVREYYDCREREGKVDTALTFEDINITPEIHCEGDQSRELQRKSKLAAFESKIKRLREDVKANNVDKTVIKANMEDIEKEYQELHFDELVGAIAQEEATENLAFSTEGALLKTTKKVNSILESYGVNSVPLPVDDNCSASAPSLTGMKLHLFKERTFAISLCELKNEIRSALERMDYAALLVQRGETLMEDEFVSPSEILEKHMAKELGLLKDYSNRVIETNVTFKCGLDQVGDAMKMRDATVEEVANNKEELEKLLSEQFATRGLATVGSVVYRKLNCSKDLQAELEINEKAVENAALIYEEFLHTYPQHLELLRLKKQMTTVAQDFHVLTNAIKALEKKLPGKTDPKKK